MGTAKVVYNLYTRSKLCSPLIQQGQVDALVHAHTSAASADAKDRNPGAVPSDNSKSGGVGSPVLIGTFLFLLPWSPLSSGT